MRTKDATDGEAVATRPFLVLVVSLFCQIGAGVPYWFPAIIPGVEESLALEPSQSALLVLFATSGSFLGLVGGLFHDRYGSRIAATASAFCLSIILCLLALFTKYPPKFLGPFLFPVLLTLTIAMVTCTYTMYASSVSTAASVFPPVYRGRVVGLSVAAYGGSGGVLSASQAAFLPRLDQAPTMLLVVSLVCMSVGIASLAIYPTEAKFDNDSLVMHEEYNPINIAADRPCHTHIDNRLHTGYTIAFVWLFALQSAALADVLQMPIGFKITADVTIMLCLLSLFSLPLTSPLRISPMATDAVIADYQAAAAAAATGANDHDDQNMSERDPAADESTPEPSMMHVLPDIRFIYLSLASISFVGGGGVAILVQLPYILKALRYGVDHIWSALAVNVLVRAFVTLFSACNMAGRLTTGFVMDHGEDSLQRHMWKFTLVKCDTLIMGAAVALLALPWRVAIVLGVALGGFAWGSWFASVPALVTLWFGVHSFPRNFAVLGAFETAGAFMLATSLPQFMRKRFGNMIEVEIDGKMTEVCAGVRCTFPTFLTLAIMSSSLCVAAFLLRPVVRRKAQALSF